MRLLSSFWWRAGACLVVVASAWAQEELPPGATVRGKTSGIGDLPLVAETPLVVTVPADAADAVLRVKAGKDPKGVAIYLNTDVKGTPFEVDLRAKDFITPLTKKVWSDAYLEGYRGSSRFFTRPNPTFAKEDRIKLLAQSWESLPAASDHVTNVEFRRTETGVRIWFDGKFIQEQPLAGQLLNYEVRLPAGAELQAFRFQKKAPPDLLALPLQDYARPGAGPVEVTLTPEAKLPEGLPAKGGAWPEIALGGLGRLNSPADDLVTYAWQRSGLDALPEVCIFSVPLESYSWAHVLCAAEEDPAKARAFTLRLTRYGTSRGAAMADTVVRLPEPGATPDPDCRSVGTVKLGDKTVPLWLVRVPIKSGLITDLLTTDQRKSRNYPNPRYLDIEVLDPLDGVDETDAFPPSLGPTGRTYTPRSNPRGLQSAVHLLGISLERSPATLTVEANTPVNMFYAADAPEFKVTVKAVRDGAFTLAWDFADLDGKIAATGTKPLTFTGEKREETVTIPVQATNGWYATRWRLLSADGRAFIDHRSTFVMLSPDTRKAGFESAHGTWWFHWAHGGEPNIARVGPMLQRAGLRHTILPKTLPESLTAPYGVTAWNIGWFRSKNPDPVARLAEHEAFIREQLALYPSLDKILVGHESGAAGALFPSELWGDLPAAPDAEVEAKWRERIDYYTALAKLVRAKFPQLKLQFGNDGDSLKTTAGLLRRGFPREYIDLLATEDLGQTIITEKAIPGGLQSAWYLRETARVLGYPDIPPTACHEWMGRRDMMLGLGGQAEYYVRDVLHAKAYGFQTIAIGTVHDAGNGYYHTGWGAGGLCYRYPAMDPKPSYAAIATVTRVLDSAKFERAVPTGSLSAYVLEFRRGDEWIYATWVPRGRREVKLTFPAATDTTLVDLYGREKTSQQAEITLTASTAAQYLVTKSRLASVSAGRSWFPEDAPPQNPTMVDPLDSLASFLVQPASDKRLERLTGDYMPHRTQGKFEVREVEDSEKGKCLEVELKPAGDLWDVTHEYAVLKFKNPITAAGPFDNAGVWVKGNSGWGEIMWEFQDARGVSWLSQGVYMDWPGQIAINFDGWNFLRLPLRPDLNWRKDIKITGLVVTMPRKALYLTEMERVMELKVRVKDLSVF